DIPVPVTAERPYSTDRNLFHISYEGGILEAPWAEPPDKMFQLTQSPESAPDIPVEVLLEFEHGDPVAVDGRRLGPVELLTALNRLGGEHGIGRVDLVENRFVGMKSRGVYETPGGTIVHVARRALESLTLDRERLHRRDRRSGAVTATTPSRPTASIAPPSRRRPSSSSTCCAPPLASSPRSPTAARPSCPSPPRRRPARGWRACPTRWWQASGGANRS